MRTVVFRGWMQNPIRDDDDVSDPGNCIDTDVHLKFITDLRSQKMLQGKVAEACWYFTESREQFRLHGEVVMVTHENTDSALIRQRSGLWKSISDSARAAYKWPAPGSDRSEDADDDQDYRCTADIGTVSDNFVMMLLRPTSIDHLRLKGFPQKRTKWSIKEDHSWESWNVNP